MKSEKINQIVNSIRTKAHNAIYPNLISQRKVLCVEIRTKTISCKNLGHSFCHMEIFWLCVFVINLNAY